jgi:transcriptional repressor NrdR
MDSAYTEIVKCPFCGSPDTKVIDSRAGEDGKQIRRRRLCNHCSKRFSTVEAPSLSVIKRSGAKEPFSRQKVLNGILKATQGRNLELDQLKVVAFEVENTIRAMGQIEVDSYDIGLAALEPLKKLDDVAYLRFASVYQGYASLDDFTKEIAKLKKSHKKRR